MNDANFNPAKDAPPQQDRSTDKAGPPASDRIEAAERGQMQAEAKAHGRDARDNRPADARGKDQPVEADRGDAASRPAKAEQKTEQQAEREAITTLPNRAGFRFDSSQVDRSEVKRVLDNLSPEQQAALRDPSATVMLTGRASRAGDAQHNMELSQERAANFAAELRANGVTAQIQTFAYGEQEAMDVGQADGVDDRDFRSVSLDVLPGQHRDIEEQTTLTDSQAAGLAEKWTEQVPDLSKVDRVKELGERGKVAVEEFVAAAKDVISGNPEKALAKGVKAELAMFAEALEHRDYRANVSLNLIPAFLQEFDRIVLDGSVHFRSPEVVEHPGAYRSAESKAEAMKAVRNGVLLVHNALDNKSAAEIREIKQAAKDMNNLARLHREFERVLHRKLNH